MELGAGTPPVAGTLEDIRCSRPNAHWIAPELASAGTEIRRLPIETPRNAALIIDDVRDRAAWLKASLELADFHVIGVLAWEQVDEHSIQAASADVIIVDADAPGRDTLEQISLMSTTLEKPVVVLGGQKDQRSIQEAMRAGVSAYVAHTIQGEDLSGIIQVAAARFAEHKRLRDELREVKDQLAERKQVDRAKGILIADHGYSEAEAYKRMRSLAMSKGKRMAEIAEAIIFAKELSA